MAGASFFDRMVSQLRSTSKYYTGYPKDLGPSRIIPFTSERQFVQLLHEGRPVVVAFTIKCTYTQHLDKVLEEAAATFYPHIKFVRVECPKYPGFCLTRQKTEYPFLEVFYNPEQDEDFVLHKDDGGSPTDDSGGEESDASESGGEKEKSSKKEARSSKPPVKRKPKGKDGEGSEKRKPKKKKDPNAPKRPMMPFMYFSMAERAGVKDSNPDLAPKDIAKKLGEMWQKMSTEDKQPYILQSQVDKKRYEKESAAYRAAAPVDVDAGSGNGSE